jgi:hypothetical protein
MQLIGYTSYLEAICFVSLLTASLLGTAVIHCCSLNLVEFEYLYRLGGQHVTVGRGLCKSGLIHSLYRTVVGFSGAVVST